MSWYRWMRLSERFPTVPRFIGPTCRHRRAELPNRSEPRSGMAKLALQVSPPPARCSPPRTSTFALADGWRVPAVQSRVPRPTMTAVSQRWEVARSGELDEDDIFMLDEDAAQMA